MSARLVRDAVERWGGTVEVVEVGPIADIGAARLAEKLEHRDLPTALIGVTDMTTLAILRFLAERQMVPGDDVSVIGFDDYPWMWPVARPSPSFANPSAAWRTRSGDGWFSAWTGWSNPRCHSCTPARSKRGRRHRS